MTTPGDVPTRVRIDSATIDDMELEDEVVVLNLDTQGYFGLNATGTEIWRLIKAHPGIAVDDIVAQLAARYGQAPDVIADDVRRVWHGLWREHLVIESEPAAPPPPAAERSEHSYQVPLLEPYGELDSLILSGE